MPRRGLYRDLGGAEQRSNGMTKRNKLGIAVVTTGAVALAAGTVAGVEDAQTACTIEDWSFHWEENQFAKGGGWLEIEGVLAAGYTGRFITIIAYRVNADGKRGDRFGNGKGLIGTLGDFEVAIEGPPPGDRLSIRYGCD